MTTSEEWWIAWDEGKSPFPFSSDPNRFRKTFDHSIHVVPFERLRHLISALSMAPCHCQKLLDGKCYRCTALALFREAV